MFLFFRHTYHSSPTTGVFCLTRLYYVAGSYTRTYIYIRNRTTFVSLTNCSSVWRNGSTFSCPRKHEARESRRHGHNSCRYVFFSFPSPLFSSRLSLFCLVGPSLLAQLPTRDTEETTESGGAPWLTLMPRYNSIYYRLSIASTINTYVQ